MVTTAAAEVVPVGTGAILAQLGGVCRGRGLPDLAERLAGLHALVREDLEDVEASLAHLPRDASLVRRSAHHLLDLGGKRLRPTCVALASRVGAGFDAAARELAVAVELVHAATLLHDDVVDVGATRRGAPAARAIYGNAASIFAGDWLLIEALRRVRRARVPSTFDRLLAVIEEMILAESLQLEGRGRVAGDRETYFRVVEGKTAALFRWAMYAGGQAGRLPERACQALEGYGMQLGVAFQAIDDLLDFTGDVRTMGKVAFADLREGKLTYPLIVALERDPSLLPLCAELAAAPVDEPPPETVCARVREALRATGALDETLELAQSRAARAVAHLGGLPPGPGTDALATVAAATVYRER